MSPEPTLVREVDLGLPLAGVDGGPGRVWLLLRLGEHRIGELMLPLPATGLTGAQLGAAVAARFGAAARRPRDDGQPRSRRRGEHPV